MTKADSLLLAKYRNEVIKKQASPEDSLSTVEDIVASWGNSRLDNGEIKYAPDNSFKIITFILENCGAYCNSEWYSWMQYNLNGKTQIKSVDFSSIDTIYQLPEKKYLIIDSYGGRPASVLTVNCMNANLISFEGDSLVRHPIIYKNKKSFGFCQENGADMDKEPYIKYDTVSKKLLYHYANNYAYSKGIDIDTIRQGQFIYSRGHFILEKETIKVQDQSKLPTTINEWTENYKINRSDTTNIHIDRINEHQLVYDCVGCNSMYSEAIKVFSLTNGIKKQLLSLPTNGANLQKILLMKIKENNFIYIVTNETSGNSDGYLYYLDTTTMTAHKVEVEKSDTKLPKGYQAWGSYSYLDINDDATRITTSSQFIDTTSENRKGRIITYYQLDTLKKNQFVLKKTKREEQFDE
ncbi:MAG: hypothetical protein WCJ62_10260 [Flavobacterium sp.]